MKKKKQNKAASRSRQSAQHKGSVMPPDGKKKIGSLILQWVIILLIVLALVGGVIFGALAISPASGLEQSATSSFHYADMRETDAITGKPASEYVTTDSSTGSTTTDIPSVSADYAGLCTSDGRVLFARNIDVQTPMASTTKIMTAVVALEAASLDTVMKVTLGAAATPGTEAGIEAGTTLPLSDLLYCLLVPSGNDAAVCIAENIAGMEVRFVEMMNKKAQELGMTSTHYSDSSGLTEVEHYTTINDYFKLTCYAMKNKTFREVVATRYKEITVGDKVLELTSTSHLWDTLKGAEVTGIKTGHTDAAGYCFVGGAMKNGVELYSITFRDSDPELRFTDAATLLEWGLRHFRTIELLNTSQQVGSVSCTSWLDKTVDVFVPAAVRIEIFDMNGPIDQTIELRDIEGSVTKGQVCGKITWSQDGEVLADSDIVANETVGAPGLFESIRIGWVRFWSFATGATHHKEGSVLLKPQVPVPTATM